MKPLFLEEMSRESSSLWSCVFPLYSFLFPIATVSPENQLLNLNQNLMVFERLNRFPSSNRPVRLPRFNLINSL